jgi:hypothetical protein
MTPARHWWAHRPLPLLPLHRHAPPLGSHLGPIAGAIVDIIAVGLIAGGLTAPQRLVDDPSLSPVHRLLECRLLLPPRRPLSLRSDVQIHLPLGSLDIATRRDERRGLRGG